MEYSKKIVIRKYRVLKPFLHFKKNDVLELTLKLKYNFSSGRWNDSYIDVSSNLTAVFYDTVLPYTAVFDDNFLSADHLPYLLSSFLKECNVKDVEKVSSNLNYDIDNAEFGLERVKDYLKEIWFNSIKTEKALTDYEKRRKYK